MSMQMFAQSGQAAAPPSEAEYNAVYAAVTATERGRWFLAEFAHRNRKADTDLILAAIARIEAAIRAGAVPQAEAQALVQQQVVAAAPAAIVPVRANGGERDEADAQPASSIAPDPLPVETGQNVPQDATEDVQTQAQSDKDYSDAVAAIAASLTTRLEASAKTLVEDAVAPVREPEPQQRWVPQDNSPRWHIEAPDFVFGADVGLGEGIAAAESQSENPRLRSQLLGAEIMSEPFVPPAGAGEGPPPRLAPAEVVAVETLVEAAIEEPPAPVSEAPATPMPLSPAALDVMPLVENPRPQLRIAREPAPVNQRPPRFGSLSVTDALSEDEVMALFG